MAAGMSHWAYVCDGRTTVYGKPVSPYAMRSRVSDSALSLLYCQYGFVSGVESSRVM